MKKIRPIFYLFAIFTISLSQKVSLDGQFYPYSTYYISSFDLASGGSNVPIFRYNVSSDVYPVFVKARFKASFLSPQLGIDSRTTLIDV